VRVFQDEKGLTKQRRAEWKPEEWPRWQRLQASLAWVRARLADPPATPEGLESPFDTDGFLLLEAPSTLPVLGTVRAE
jgi:hypothetical protein